MYSKIFKNMLLFIFSCGFIFAAVKGQSTVGNSDIAISDILPEVLGQIDRSYSVLEKIQEKQEEQKILIAAVESHLNNDEHRQIREKLSTLQHAVERLESGINEKLTRIGAGSCDTQLRARDCKDIQTHFLPQKATSGVYTVYPVGIPNGLDVYCDMDTNGGGWTVIQRRQDGSVDFYRGWAAYKSGFGNLNSEFWMGNDNIHLISQQKTYAVRFDLMDFELERKFAEYNSFKVSDEHAKYTLDLGSYNGTAGDSFGGHHGANFSSKDVDNDTHGGQCAVAYKGGWWYTKCHSSNLNGLYLTGQHDSYADGINWQAWKGYHYSLKTTEMKLRPIN